MPHPTQDKLDLARLRRQDPIILLEEQVLYEDELADNGSSKVEVKIVRYINYLPGFELQKINVSLARDANLLVRINALLSAR